MAALLGAEDFALHLLQFRRDESLGVGQSLLAGVMLRHLVEVGAGHLDEISEHGIKPHLERGDAGFLDLLLLQLGDPVLALGGAPAQFVERGVEALADDAAVLESHRWIVGDGPRNQVGHLRQLVQLPSQLAQQRRDVIGCFLLEHVLAEGRRDRVGRLLHLGDHAAQAG